MLKKFCFYISNKVFLFHPTRTSVLGNLDFKSILEGSYRHKEVEDIG